MNLQGDEPAINIEDIVSLNKKMINSKRTIYNIKADQKEHKFDGINKLSKIDINLLPSYILENKKKKVFLLCGIQRL